ncbi:MAG: hypothetical protein AB7D51_05815, partial [Desulfovibrionaceae bacterium]
MVIDHMSGNAERYFSGKECSLCGNLDFPIESITNLITILDWDTQFWGFPVGYLSCMHLTENIYTKVEQFIAENNLHLVEYLCNCHDKRSVKIA